MKEKVKSTRANKAVKPGTAISLIGNLRSRLISLFNKITQKPKKSAIPIEGKSAAKDMAAEIAKANAVLNQVKEQHRSNVLLNKQKRRNLQKRQAAAKASKVGAKKSQPAPKIRTVASLDSNGKITQITHYKAFSKAQPSAKAKNSALPLKSAVDRNTHLIKAKHAKSTYPAKVREKDLRRPKFNLK
ncbi:hypothetical protein FGM00_11230 [Aggregatimonas sangjinii]|uniref:Uncharacterized protein n=1 Tax=Aggregatimonas sangjinii TaxID=2583587 RepID=A0A5B7STI4_9FLAO|nr:hypothetical protein [Aggregatimonas sangjinii]QCX00649.1 hypothetical protein FGM00_11230 [Aggregatimonas sangjinii]